MTSTIRKRAWNRFTQKHEEGSERMSKIDFVIPWVDGSDSAWRAEKNLWAQKISGETAVDDSESRYRDWDNLRYWFRSVEKFAPWVNRVFFVTNGQKPEWLNTEHPKLRFVKHSDYIPEKYLPTFSSHVIEINLHRIEDLSEQFVYFNDDTFLLREIRPEIFFQGDLPVLPAALTPICPFSTSSPLLGHVYFNMYAAVNRNFKMRRSLQANKRKWFSLRNCGMKLYIGNLFFSRYNEFVGFKREHMPCPILKETMRKVWEAEPALMDTTSGNRFRTGDDVNQYIFRYWDLAAGNFVPRKFDVIGKCIHLRDREDDQLAASCRAIMEQKSDMICVNDAYDAFEEFEKGRDAINEALRTVLKERSAFELP